jgi:hypothetical protein
MSAVRSRTETMFNLREKEVDAAEATNRPAQKRPHRMTRMTLHHRIAIREVIFSAALIAAAATVVAAAVSTLII